MKTFFDVKIGDKLLYVGPDNIITEVEVTKNDYYNGCNYIMLKDDRMVNAYWDDFWTSHITGSTCDKAFTCTEAIDSYIESLQSDLNKLEKDISSKKQMLKKYKKL